MPKLGEAFVVIRAALGPLRAGLATAKSAVTKAMSIMTSTIKKAMSVTYKYIKRAMLAISGVIGYAVYTFGNFDKAMRRATAAMGVTDKEFIRLSKMVREQSIKINVKAIEAAEGIKQLGYAGLSAAESMKVFVPLLKFAKAGMADMTLATKSTLDIMGSYQIGFHRVKEVTDLLLKAWTTSRMELDEMAEALSFTGATASTSKLKLEELLTVFWALAEAGIRGTRAGTTVRRMLLNLKAPMSSTSKAMKDLGVNVYDSAGKMRPFIKIFEEMGNALMSVTEQERNMAMKVIFGHRAVEGATIAWRKSAEEIRNYTKSLEGASGTVDKVLKFQLDTLSEQFGRLRKAIGDIAKVFGSTLAPALRFLIKEAINKTLKWRDALEKHKYEIMRWAAVVVTRINFVRGVIQDFIVGAYKNWPETWKFLKDVALGQLDVIWKSFNLQIKSALQVAIKLFVAFGKSLWHIFDKIWSDFENRAIVAVQRSFAKQVEYIRQRIKAERKLTKEKGLKYTWSVKGREEAARMAREKVAEAERQGIFEIAYPTVPTKPWSEIIKKIKSEFVPVLELAKRKLKEVRDKTIELQKAYIEGLKVPGFIPASIEKRLKEMREAGVRLKKQIDDMEEAAREGVRAGELGRPQDRLGGAAAGVSGMATDRIGGRIGFTGLKEAWNRMAQTMQPKDRTQENILKVNRDMLDELESQTGFLGNLNLGMTE